MALRIIAGGAPGRRLRVPGGRTRPTSSLVRGALFNMLEHRGWLENADVVDLYAGSGALGIEALSRGAPRATFVDSGKPALAAIRGNLAELGLADRATVVAGDAIGFVGKPIAEPWSLVLIDPPYASDLATRAASALPRESLATGAVLVIEHDRRNAPHATLGVMTRFDERRYGDTLISLYRLLD